MERPGTRRRRPAHTSWPSWRTAPAGRWQTDPLGGSAVPVRKALGTGDGRQDDPSQRRDSLIGTGEVAGQAPSGQPASDRAGGMAATERGDRSRLGARAAGCRRRTPQQLRCEGPGRLGVRCCRGPCTGQPGGPVYGWDPVTDEHHGVAGQPPPAAGARSVSSTAWTCGRPSMALTRVLVTSPGRNG